MNRFLIHSLLGAVAILTVALPAAAQMQDKYATEYAKDKNKLGLFLDSEELSQTKARYTMNGFAVAFQADRNVCLVKSDDSFGGWCMAEEFPAWKKTAKVKFVKGTLQAIDGTGKVVWQTKPLNDPYARLIISPQGKLMIINAGGNVYWMRPGKK